MQRLSGAGWRFSDRPPLSGVAAPPAGGRRRVFLRPLAIKMENAMTLAEMKAKLEGLKADASATLDKIEAAGGFGVDAASEHETALETTEAEIGQLKGEIEAAEKLAEKRRQMHSTGSRPALQNRVNDPNPETTGGFKSMAEFATAVRGFVANGDADRRLFAAPSNVHQGDGGSGEGFLLPAEFRDEIWNAVSEQDDFLSRFSLTPTGNRSIEMIKDETTPWGSAGISANWRAEGTQMTPDKLALKASRMELHDLYAFAAVTEEMLSDAPRLNAQLQAKAGQAIAYKAAEAVMFGNGAGQPLGYMESGALVTVAKESGQSAATIVPANINKMYSRLTVPAGDQPFWVANRDIFPQLQAMGFGSDTPLFYPPTGITGAPNGTLLGYPVVYTEHAQTLGTLGDLSLVTPSGYFAAVRGGGVQFASSIHLWFDYGAQAFRWTFRMGGQPMLSEPISPDKGSATKSHFVALATRS